MREHFGRIQVRKLKADFPVADLDHAAWESAEPVLTCTYWSGEAAPAWRHFGTRMIWCDSGLYVRFEANQEEPLVVGDAPVLDRKTIGLWERDVCEIFIAPDREEPRRYFEFEAAPTGEWLDLAVHQRPDRRETDWDYSSGMACAARIGDGTVTMVIRVPWEALGREPAEGDVWMGNLLRCVGSGETRGYLAWQPTLTPEPNFHVPDRFGEFIFIR